MAEIIFPGPEGRLEGKFHKNENKNAPAALILHPHPRHGGTMNNKVVYHLYHSFVKSGFSVLRFNFRGVGRSQGKFDNGIGELSDAASALDWLQLQNPDASTFWISGFSFGSWISLQLLMRRPELEGFIAVSPPANMYDFNFLSPCPSSGLIVQGDQDSIVPVEEVNKLAAKLSSQKNIKIDYKVVPGADHFFRNNLDQFVTACDAYLGERTKEMGRKVRVKPDRRRRQLQAVAGQ